MIEHRFFSGVRHIARQLTLGLLCGSLVACGAKSLDKQAVSGYVSQLAQFDPGAKVIPITIKEQESLQIKDNQVYAYSVAGMQRRPVLRQLYPTPRTLKGVDARRLSATLYPAAPRQMQGKKTKGLCAQTKLECYYNASDQLIFVFSAKRQLVELIELSGKTTAAAQPMRRILGNDLFIKEKTGALYAAVDSGERQRESQLLEQLGDDVDLRRLFAHSKLDRHKQWYLDELRQQGTYASYDEAFTLSGDSADLQALFTVREGHLQRFIDTIDAISVGDAPAAKGDNQGEFTAAIDQFNRAPDIVALRDRNRRAAEAEQQRAAQQAERERIAAAKRAQEAKAARQRERERLATLRKERQKHIGRQASWVHAKRIDTDDCASLMGLRVACLWVTYRYQISGEIVAVDEENQRYVVNSTSQRLLVPGAVSFKYLQLKDQALAEGQGLVGRSFQVAFDDIEF